VANTIRIKRSSTASNVPTAGELLEGELAINTNPADRKLYSKDSGGTVFEIGAAYTHPTHPGDDFSVDSGALTGANVISDIDINVTTDTLGHVTDANGVIATRALTAGDIGAATSSHTHTFDSLTSKASGTGDYLTTGDFGAGENSGGPALTINDGYGNSNLTFNHRNGTPDNTSATQSAARIEASTDSNTASLSFELGNSTVQDTPVALTQVMEMTTGRIQSEVNHDFLAGIDVTGNITVTGTVDGRDVATDGTKLDGIEALADVTDATNVAAAGAAMLNQTETITGTWTLDGAVTTSDYGTGGRVKDGTDVSRPIGFNVMPVYEIDANDTFDLAHNGMLWHKDANATVTFSCPNDTTIPQGATYAVFNDDTELVTISPNTGVTLYWLEAGAAPSSGSFTIAQGGIVTVYKYSDTEWWAWGSKESGGGSGGSLSGLSDTDITSPADASFLIYDTGTGDWRDFVLSGDVTCTDGGVVSVIEGNVAHDSLSGFVANEHINHTSVSISAGNGLTGGGDISTTRTLTLGTPSSITDTSTNSVTTSSHTHAVSHTGTGSFAMQSSPTFTTKITSDKVFLNEASGATTDVAGDGQIWVKNNAPNDLYFTGDTGIDYPVAYATYRKTSATALDNANQTLNMGTESVADAMVNGCWYSDNSTAYTLTLEDSGTTHFPVGAQMTVWNEGSGTLTINEGTGTTLYVMTGSARTDSAGGCTLGTGGYATIIRKSTTIYLIMGAGITP
jgi:hypothetical protein